MSSSRSHSPVASASNPKLRLVRRLQSASQRERLGLFVCEGEDLIVAGLEAGLEPEEVLIDASRLVLVERVPGATLVASELMGELSELAHPARAIAVFRRSGLPQLDPANAAEVGLALWRVADPGNVGALLRSADAFGAGYVCLSSGCADPTGAKALRASMGAVFRVPLGAFDGAPGRRIGLVAHGGAPLAEVGLSGPVCFVLGAERDGLPDEVAAGCDELATIPLAAGAESLNVAVAGALALYERRRQTS
ncbi:MAG TPA: RNA methyltransferase [Gaiellaceae bacterium]|jgi:RNA methyltransferase, TrmH family